MYALLLALFYVRYFLVHKYIVCYMRSTVRGFKEILYIGLVLQINEFVEKKYQELNFKMTGNFQIQKYIHL